MRIRVAHAATLFTLLILVVLVVLSCVSLVGERNRDYQGIWNFPAPWFPNSLLPETTRRALPPFRTICATGALPPGFTPPAVR